MTEVPHERTHRKRYLTAKARWKEEGDLDKTDDEMVLDYLQKINEKTENHPDVRQETRGIF